MLSDEVQAYRQWVLSCHVDGCTIEEGDGDAVVLRSDVASGAVSFYDIDGSTVVELRLESTHDDTTLFYLHSEFGDEERAQRLFTEMLDVLAKRIGSEVQHVLLCCSCGMTTTFFANKLNELAAEHDLKFDFCAKPIEEAKRSGTTYIAVLLAPQVGHQLREVREALPGVIVLELPASLFGTYDANGVLQLLMHALKKARHTARSDLRFARDYDRTKSVLGVSYVYRSDEPTLSYAVLDRGEELLCGTLVRNAFDVQTVLEDLFSTLRLSGYTPKSFDAIGIALPGDVDNGAVVERDEDGTRRVEMSTQLSEKWGVPVFVDNNATAAAAGCYVSQSEWDTVVFHAQPIGVADCDQGYVIDAKPHTGHGGFGGNMRYLAEKLELMSDLEAAAWRYDGMRKLVAYYLSANICTIAPDALFVWCDFLPDMQELREELERIVPADVIPELVGVADYDGLTLMGEISLCLQRLVK